MSAPQPRPARPAGRFAVALSAAVVLATGHAQGLPPPPASPAPVTNYRYDANGNLTRTIQGPGVPGFGLATTHVYDRLQRRIRTTDAAGGVTALGYDGLDQLTGVTDPRSLVTRYTRNGLGHTTQLDSPDTGTATHTYDALGNLKTRTDSRGVQATYSHDALDRLTKIVHRTAQGGQLVHTWTYDQTGEGYSHGIGRLTSTAHPSGSTQYAHDAAGRVLTDIQRIKPAPGANDAWIGRTVTYAYDAAGRVTRLRYPSGRVLSITYAGGRPSALALARGANAVPEPLLSQIQWEPFAGVRRWQWHLAGGPQLHERSHDLYGRVVRYRLGRHVRDLTYDAADRIAAYTHYTAATGARAPWLDQSFGYDAAGRLTGIVTAHASWSIGYDANGNRTHVTRDGTRRGYTTQATSNRLLRIGNPVRSFAYDEAGNTTGDGTRFTATYDLAGRLATLSRSGATTRYDYDGFGRRVRKFDSTGPHSTVLFVYGQDGQLLGEYDRAGQPLREYVWLGSTPVAVFTPDPVATQPPRVYFIHADHLDTPRVVVDRDDNLRWRWLGEPFGTAAAEEDPAGLGAFEMPLRFPGQYYDRESGLAYNWHRYYDATRGSYTQFDPIGLAGGTNTYAYADGSPTTRTDPLGLATFMCTKPLHGLGDKWGPRMYPESRWNPSPAYHQFLCVKDASGKVTCGGQDRTGGSFVPGSPGKPSDDSWPSSGNGSCEKQDDRDCVDQCVIKAVSNRNRPWYAIGPLGTDCQEWADEALKQCQKQCKAKK